MARICCRGTGQLRFQPSRSALHCGNGQLPGLQQELDLSFQHLHHLEDEAAGRPEEGETSSTKSRRYLGWLNEDLGPELANACVFGVEVVHFRPHG